MAVPAVMSGAAPVEPRPAGVTMMEAMQHVKEPAMVSLLTPVVGALGVVLGARARKGKPAA
jgi:hypothetical protein